MANKINTMKQLKPKKLKWENTDHWERTRGDWVQIECRIGDYYFLIQRIRSSITGKTVTENRALSDFNDFTIFSSKKTEMHWRFDSVFEAKEYFSEWFQLMVTKIISTYIEEVEKLVKPLKPKKLKWKKLRGDRVCVIPLEGTVESYYEGPVDLLELYGCNIKDFSFVIYRRLFNTKAVKERYCVRVFCKSEQVSANMPDSLKLKDVKVSAYKWWSNYIEKCLE